MAISYLMQAFGDDIPESVLPFETDPAQLKLLKQMIQKGINSPLTSSCGRLFDAVAALAGVRDKVSYEGQAALELEMVLQDDAGQAGCYPFEIRKEHGLLVVSAVKMIQQLISDLRNNVSKEKISARFHNGLVKTIVDVCVALRVDHRKLPVALSGGVFQNRYLTERAMRLLKEDGFEVLVHRQVPPNDGGLSLGQAVIAGHLEER